MSINQERINSQNKFKAWIYRINSQNKFKVNWNILINLTIHNNQLNSYNYTEGKPGKIVICLDSRKDEWHSMARQGLLSQISQLLRALKAKMPLHKMHKQKHPLTKMHTNRNVYAELLISNHNKMINHNNLCVYLTITFLTKLFMNSMQNCNSVTFYFMKKLIFWN